MNPEYGQFIQVRFNNGVFFDAVVESWSDEKSVLILPDTSDKVVIQKTIQDVLLVKILAHKNVPECKVQHKTEVDREFEELKDQPKTDETLTRMAELKDKLNQIEREEVFSKAAMHKPSGMKEVTYGIPRNIQISSAAQYTAEEITLPNSKFNSELSELFSQKH
jgi:hypothetical protein